MMKKEAWVIFFWAVIAMRVEASPLASHQAVYEFDLKSATSAADINSINGRTHYMLKKVCDGWVSSENYAISFGFIGGNSADFITQYETWESDENSSFTFETIEHSTVTGKASYQGFAHQRDGRIEAFHSDGDGRMRNLPDNTVFPIQYTIRLLEDAEAGGPIIRQAHLFFGGEVSDSLYFVSTVMGKKKSGQLQKTLAETMGTLGEDEYWPLSIAYYNPDATESVPEYSVVSDIQPNGIIRGYTVDYGTFTLRARLKKLEPLAPEECG